MQRKIIWFSLAFLGFTSFAASQNKETSIRKADLYWVSYIKNGCCVFLMEIDSTGRAVKAPIQIDGGPTLSLNGTNRINIWKYQRRIVLDENSLNEVQTIRTRIGEPIFVTQKPHRNFAVLSGNDPAFPSLKFVPVSPNGKRIGASWIISSTDTGSCDFLPCPEGEVSADGKLLIWSILDFGPSKLYLQQLEDTGKANGPQKLIDTNNAVFAGAVSNPLSNGQFFVLYSLRDQVFLQAFDIQTEQKVGDPIPLLRKRLGFKPVAIDPLGRFVVYSYKNRHNVHFLSYQALDATGHPSGKPIVLVKEVDAYDIHLLKDE